MESWKKNPVVYERRESNFNCEEKFRIEKEARKKAIDVKNTITKQTYLQKKEAVNLINITEIDVENEKQKEKL